MSMNSAHIRQRTILHSSVARLILCHNLGSDGVSLNMQIGAPFNKPPTDLLWHNRWIWHDTLFG